MKKRMENEERKRKREEEELWKGGERRTGGKERNRDVVQQVDHQVTGVAAEAKG